ncbi:MAG TPA: protein-tyrosine-phosphatase, partial [Paraburkholderia sp.]|nr:protein-tyrosine-phosphatase [Paraburkholderia sp.]
MSIAATVCSPRRLAASTPLRGPRVSRRAFLRGSAGVLLFSSVGSTLLSACGGGNLNADQPDTPRLAS